MCHACLVFTWTDLQKLFLRNHFIFFFQSTMIRKRYSAPTFFMLFESNSLRKIQGSFIFIDINHGFCQPCYSLTIWPKISRAFCFCASCRSDRVLSMLFNSCLDALAHSVTEVVGFSFLSSNVLKNLANCCCHFVRKKPELDLVDSNSVRNHTSDYQTRTNARSPICQL